MVAMYVARGMEWVLGKEWREGHPGVVGHWRRVGEWEAVREVLGKGDREMVEEDGQNSLQGGDVVTNAVGGRADNTHGN